MYHNIGELHSGSNTEMTRRHSHAACASSLDFHFRPHTWASAHCTAYTYGHVGDLLHVSSQYMARSRKQTAAALAHHAKMVRENPPKRTFCQTSTLHKQKKMHKCRILMDSCVATNEQAS